jgi:hypothetical protein
MNSNTNPMNKVLKYALFSSLVFSLLFMTYKAGAESNKKKVKNIDAQTSIK